MAEKNCFPEAAVLSSVRALWIEDGTLYGNRGLALYVSKDYGKSFSITASYRAGFLENQLAKYQTLRRLGRAGFHHLRILPDGSMVAVVRGAILHRERHASSFRKVLDLERGSRPLNLCLAPSGAVYFGEYFRNPKRTHVSVYGSDDGRSWTVVHSFRAGEIRHIHGIFVDRYRGGMWLLTGDQDRESGIWYTDDEFRNLEAVARGSQRVRAASIIPRPSGLIVPTDTPLEKNYIEHLDVESGKLEILADLPGSALHTAACSNLFLVSTAVEPSEVNTSRYASLFASVDGWRWKCVGKFSGGLPFLRRAERYLGYADLALIDGHNETPFAYANGVAISGLSGRLMRWSVDEVVDYLTVDEVVQ